MKTLKIEDGRRASLFNPCEAEPFWTLDFHETTTGLSAIREALKLLGRLGETVESVTLAGLDVADPKVFIFRIGSTMAAKATPCEEHRTYV